MTLRDRAAKSLKIVILIVPYLAVEKGSLAIIDIETECNPVGNAKGVSIISSPDGENVLVFLPFVGFWAIAKEHERIGRYFSRPEHPGDSTSGKDIWLTRLGLFELTQHEFSLNVGDNFRIVAHRQGESGVLSFYGEVSHSCLSRQSPPSVLLLLRLTTAVLLTACGKTTPMRNTGRNCGRYLHSAMALLCAYGVGYSLWKIQFDIHLWRWLGLLSVSAIGKFCSISLLLLKQIV